MIYVRIVALFMHVSCIPKHQAPRTHYDRYTNVQENEINYLDLFVYYSTRLTNHLPFQSVFVSEHLHKIVLFVELHRYRPYY